MTTPPPDATDAAVADHAAATYSPSTSASGRPSATSPPPKSYPVALQISTPLSFPSMFNQHQQQYQHQQYLNRHQCQPGIAQAMLARLSTSSMSSVDSNLSLTTRSTESMPLQTPTQEDDDDDGHAVYAHKGARHGVEMKCGNCDAVGAAAVLRDDNSEVAEAAVAQWLLLGYDNNGEVAAAAA
ncbi:hypothetical protein BDZ97DRAFT_1919073 [Flammula alnicola]|nr:hypothetical protein BDZ97DRAFT_1919073 [Flammula alnicola]